jgi:predicted DNA-binding transcriptional regulator YafY
MARAAEEAMVKIDAVIPERMRVRQNEIEIHAFAPEMTEDVRALIDFLELAADNRKRLSISYSDAKGQTSDRVLRPARPVVLGKSLDAGGLVRIAQ